MTFTSYIQKLKALFQKGEALEANPRRDWVVLIVFVALGLVVSVWWNTSYFFEVVESGNDAPSGAVVTEGTEASVERVENGFRERAREAQRYERERVFVDPS
jgi:H+/Cl- antiporter ClcA